MKIIACGDIHIRNLRRIEEYQQQLQKFVDACGEHIGENPEDYTIVITGDLFHNKLDISSEGYVLANWFLRKLDELSCPVYVIAGNHDLNMKNLERLSPIDTLFSLGNYANVLFLDKELEYKSGIWTNGEVNFVLYSSYDNFVKPEIDRDEYNVGLIHAEIKGCKTDTGYVGENGIPTSHFEGLDVCLCGHIHKRQTLTYDETDIIYTGSLIQQDHGERITGHGYIIWDTETDEYTEYDIPNENNGFYTFQINSEEDIKDDKEEILNL